jgi:hypothetical protein
VGNKINLFSKCYCMHSRTYRTVFTTTTKVNLGFVSPCIKLRGMRWAGHVAHMGEDRSVHRVLVGKPEGKMPLGRPRRRREDNIKMDIQEVGGDRGDWMELAQDRDR